jgi:hypothetical protein
MRTLFAAVHESGMALNCHNGGRPACLLLGIMQPRLG